MSVFSDVQLAVVKALILPPGTVRFDLLTGTKLLTQMKAHFSIRTIKKTAEILAKIMRNVSVRGNAEGIGFIHHSKKRERLPFIRR